MASARTRALADSTRGLRVVISVQARRLWALRDDDTLLSAPVAVASDSMLEYQGRRWRFAAPVGVWSVLSKDSLPLWVPPDWHYYEVARQHGWIVRHLATGRATDLGDGRRLEIRDGSVGIANTSLDGGEEFVALAVDEEIVFDGVLYVPPLGTRNRAIAGELGRYRLRLPGGYALHGTPWSDTIGAPATHGCFRLRDDDVAWLYTFVPVGTPVFVF